HYYRNLWWHIGSGDGRRMGSGHDTAELLRLSDEWNVYSAGAKGKHMDRRDNSALEFNPRPASVGVLRVLVDTAGSRSVGSKPGGFRCLECRSSGATDVDGFKRSDFDARGDAQTR